MPGQTDFGVHITRYLSHRDYTIVQRECYHRHAKHILPCVKAAGEKDSLKRLKNTVLSISCPLRLKSKGDPILQIYLDVPRVQNSCISVCFSRLGPTTGTYHIIQHFCTRPTVVSVWNKMKSEQNKIYAKCNANMWSKLNGSLNSLNPSCEVNTEPVRPG